jgi:hypothetical protein
LLDTNLTVSGDFESEGTVVAAQFAGPISADYITGGTISDSCLSANVTAAVVAGESFLHPFLTGGL